MGALGIALSAANPGLLPFAVRRSSSGGGGGRGPDDDEIVRAIGVFCMWLGIVILVGLAIWGIIEWIT